MQRAIRPLTVSLWVLIAVGGVLAGLLTLRIIRVPMAEQPLPEIDLPAGPAASSSVPPSYLRLAGPLPVEVAFGSESGLLTMAGSELTSAIQTTGGAVYRLPGDVEPSAAGGYRLTTVEDPLLGPAHQLVAEYLSRDRLATVTVEVTAARDLPALLYQLRLSGADEMAPVQFTLFEAERGGLDLSGPVEAFTLLSPGPTQRTLQPGEDPLGLPLPQGAPLLLWSDLTGHGYVLGFLDDSMGRSTLQLIYTEDGSLRVVAQVHPQLDVPTSSPRLFVQLVTTPEPGPAFAAYRAALQVVAPAPAVPASFRQQWGSWYVYGAGITEERLRAQIDTIANGYGDLGPWQIVIDAGWYLSGAHPEGAMGVVDEEKFPSGMRALVDYAHARGVGVLLYGAAPWVDSRPSIGSWWVVQLGLVRDHPDWLIVVDEDDEGAAYVYDFSQPEVRAYLDGLMRRYLVEFDADGILLDMVGLISAEGGHLRGDPISLDTLVSPELAQTKEVYRFTWETATRYKPEVWIEGGYAAPPLARRWAHTWRLADDFPAFSHPYPFAGLLEQLTYAILQDQLLGRRAHLGFIYGGADTLDIQRQWLGAAVALQRQTILSTDLAQATPETAGMYREYLTALRPFSADPTYGPGVPPETFATTRDGTTYLGLLNTAEAPRTIAVDLSIHGIAATEDLIAFDPVRRAAIPMADVFAAPVPGQRFELLVLRTQPGVLWGDRGWTARWENNALLIQVAEGPPGTGRLFVHAPGIIEVGVSDASTGSYRRTGDGDIVELLLGNGSSHEFTLRFAPAGR